MMKKLFLLFFSLLIIVSASAQESGNTVIEVTKPAKWREISNWERHPRLDDHFWRKKVRMRIDLLEKINEPLKLSIKPNLYDAPAQEYDSFKAKYDYTRGIIYALLISYASGHITGYSPDTLDNIIEFKDFEMTYTKTVQQTAEAGPAEDSEAADDEEGWGEEEEDEGASRVSSSSQTRTVQPVGDVMSQNITELTTDFSGISNYLDVIEDRIFDKNKSDMYYEPEYIILSARKAGIIEVPLIAFRYEDVKDTVLAKTMWINRHNDAERRNLKEIFELRLFDSYITILSGEGMSGIDHSEKKRLQLLEYEHTLFEY